MSQINRMQISDFGPKLSELNTFLKDRNQIAFSDQHKFIYGPGKQMTSTEILKKLDVLAGELQRAGHGAKLSDSTKEKIAGVLSLISQLTFAKIDRRIPTDLSPTKQTARIEQIEKLAQKLGIETNRWAPLPGDKQIVMQRDLSDAANPKRKITLQHFADATAQLTSEDEEEISKLNLTQRASDAMRTLQASRTGSSVDSRSSSEESASSVGSAQSTLSTASSRAWQRFELGSLDAIRDSITVLLTKREREQIIGQMHRKLSLEDPTKYKATSSDQKVKEILAGMKDIDTTAHDLPTEIIASTIWGKSSPTTLFTSLLVVGKDVRWPDDKELHLKTHGEISRDGGRPGINVMLDGSLKAQYATNNRSIQDVTTTIHVEYDPISGKHTESIRFQ